MSRSGTVSNSTGSEHIIFTDGEHSGVEVRSPTTTDSGSLSSSRSSSDHWEQVGYEEEDDDEIDPSDSASRSRHRSISRHTVEPTRPKPTRRQSSHRVATIEEHPSRRSSRRRDSVSRDRREPREHREYKAHREHREHREHRHREHRRRAPSDDSGSVDSQYGDRGYPRHYVHRPAPNQPWGQPPPAAPYPPTAIPGHHPYDPFAGALVHLPQQDPFGYPSAGVNPFSPPLTAHGHQQNPFSPGPASSGAEYFGYNPHAPPPTAHPHHRPLPHRPANYAGPPAADYGSEVTSPYVYPPYPPHGYPPHPAAYPPYFAHPAHTPSPIPTATTKDDDATKLTAQLLKMEEERKAMRKQYEEDQQALIRKYEEERLARERALEAEKAAAAAKEAEEKLKQELIAKAAKDAKEAAESEAAEKLKKASEEAANALAEEKKSREEAEKAKKALEEQIEKDKPLPDREKLPIKFQDAVGRKFSFPFHICKTWKGMETLIRQAFQHVDIIGEHVQAGHYDLMGPDKEIILPQVWDTVIKPDWEISMHMWPMPEPATVEVQHQHQAMAQDPLAAFAGFADPMSMYAAAQDPGVGVKKKKDKKKNRASTIGAGASGAAGAPADTIMVPPPPLHPHLSMFPDPLSSGALPPGIVAVPVPEPSNVRTKPSRSKSNAGATGSGNGSGSGATTRKKEKRQELPPLAAWFAGGSVRARGREGSLKGVEELAGLGLAAAANAAGNTATTMHHSTTTHPGAAHANEQVGCVVM